MKNIGGDIPVEPTGFLINGTDLPDQLDDLSHYGSGGASDPGTSDTVNAFGSDDSVTIHNGNDTANGGAGIDFIYDFGTGNDVMNGETGNDFFFVGRGNDTVNGGTGVDLVSYQNSQEAVHVDLESGSTTAEGIDTLLSIEHVNGSSGNDVILGSSASNYLSGMSGADQLDGRAGDDSLGGGLGNDTVVGGNGADLIMGEAGNDVMTGGSEADKFVFFEWSDIAGYDTITDFQQGVDKIVLSNIDARPDLLGNQAFTFDATPDGSAEEFWDWLEGDDWQGIQYDPGPVINGEPGEIEFRHEGGNTYVYLSWGDGPTDVSLVLEGTIDLKASDFVL